VAIEEANPTSYLVRFSSFELDLRAGELRKHGVRVKLQDQPRQILVLLLENPGDIVTREQLRERLWPADTFVDFDHSLNSAVKKLRQALSDDPDVPRFIETLPRRGYRFIAPVRSAAESADLTVGAAAGTNSEDSSVQTNAATPKPGGDGTRPRHSYYHWKLWAAGAFGFVLALTLAFWFRPSGTSGGHRYEPVRLVPLTTYSGEFSQGSFSPDGNEIVYSWEGDQQQGTNIYIRQLGVDKPLQITRDFGFNFFPVWSPDGRYIALFHAMPGEEPGIFVMPALGGTPRKLHQFDHHGDCKFTLSWSIDGRSLLFSESSGAGQPCQVRQLALEDLTIRPLTSPPVPSTGDWDAQYSPDGASIAFIRNSKDVEDIYVMRGTDGAARRVTFDNRLLSGFAWTPDGKEFVFSSNRGGAVWGLWRVAIDGGSTPERLSVGSESAYMPTISLRGNRLAYASGVWSENIWRVPIGVGHHGGKPENFINSSASEEEGPQYSPDGKHIAFQSTRSGNFEIWRADSDGTNLVQLTSFGGPLTGTPRWSPDGSHIAFDTRPGAHPNVYVVSADGGPARRFVNDTADEGVASWSHDGRWIYYASNRSGTWQVWKRTADGGGQPVQVTKNGGFAPLEAPDGKSIYYTKFDDHGVWQVPVVGGTEVKIIEGEPFRGYWGYFAVGSDGLYFIGDTGSASKHQAGFKFYDYATGKITKICDMEKTPYEGAPGLSVSPDGRYILYVQVDEERNNLMLAENFR
jgi:Tol biopolymer transport system component/DNA-binding winged helix-turn-helix (wHTH) protein